MAATLLVLASAAALAAPQRFELRDPVPWDLSPDLADALLERAVGMSDPDHVADNLGAAAERPLDEDGLRRIFGRK